MNYRDFLASTRRAIGTRAKRGPDRRHTSIGRDETREVPAKGFYHTSVIVPSWGLAGRFPFWSFQAPCRSFYPSFSLLKPFTCPSTAKLDLCFYLLGLCNTLGLWPRLGRPPCSSSSLSSSSAFLFLHDRPLLPSLTSFYDEEASVPPRTLRFIAVYLSRSPSFFTLFSSAEIVDLKLHF